MNKDNGMKREQNSVWDQIVTIFIGILRDRKSVV